MSVSYFIGFIRAKAAKQKLSYIIFCLYIMTNYHYTFSGSLNSYYEQLLPVGKSASVWIAANVDVAQVYAIALLARIRHHYILVKYE